MYIFIPISLSGIILTVCGIFDNIRIYYVHVACLCNSFIFYMQVIENGILQYIERNQSLNYNIENCCTLYNSSVLDFDSAT